MSRGNLLPRLIGVLIGLVLGIYYIGVQIIGWNLTADTYQVKVAMPRGAGIFETSEVTFRGVKAGTVSDLQVTADGVDLVLKLDKKQQIPANARAEVRMLSALGENYVDLVPVTTSGPYLRNGSQIARAQVSVPVPVSEAISNASSLLKSIDPADLDTLETLLADSFTDVAPELRTLVHTGQDLTNAFIDAAPATRQLILDGQTVLKSANASRGDLTRIIRSFNAISQQFVASDADLATLLREGGSAATEIEDLVRTQTEPFKTLLSGTGKIGTAFAENDSAVRVLFGILPRVSSKLATVARNGELHGNVTINVGQPICSWGVLPLPDADNASGKHTCARGPALLQRGPRADSHR